MAKISQATIAHLSKLARIAITAEASKKIAYELDNIIDYVEKLDKLDTKGVEEISQVTGLQDVWRKDEVKPSQLSCEELLASAPTTEGGYIKVKRVL